MSDLISRAAAIDAIVFNSENRFAVDVLNDVPAVNAIPVEWLREWQDEVGTLNEWWPIIERIITVWHEEQEMRT